MPIKTKVIKICKHEITIIQFNAFEALKLRKELVAAIKLQVGDISLGEDNAASIFKGIAGLIYEIPAEMFLKLFKNCSAIEIGGLDNKTNFNTVFDNNLDGAIELAMEVLDLNGFFFTKYNFCIGKKDSDASSYGRHNKTSLERRKEELIKRLDSEVLDELVIWRLVLDKVVSYSEIGELNFIDVLKLNAILDFRIACEQAEQDEINKTNTENNGNKS